tara:strand:- start:257 stop:547 length:291 start_codon:yes stop_codon:yes gene_type:complete
MNINVEIMMSNTYGVLTNRVSVEEILEQYVDGKLETLGDAMFYGNPYEMTCEDIDEVINFYENTEEYEKCSELLQVKNDMQVEDLLDYNLNTIASR